MKRIAFVFALVLASVFTSAQVALPNITYSAILNSTCASVNGACSGGVVAGVGGVPALPQANTGSMGSGSTLDVPVNNYNAAVVTVNGTYAGSTINFEVSDATSGVNYYQVVCARSDINLLEVTEVLPSNQTRAWNCPVWGSYRFRVRQSAYTSGSVNMQITLTQAAIDPSLVVAASISNVAGASDPCQDVSAIKSSVVINITTATTTLIKGLASNQSIYVCGWDATIQGSATSVGTIQWEYGTKVTTDCDTGPVLLSGAYAGNINANVPTVVGRGGGYSVYTTPVSRQLCAISTGTTVSIQGSLTYVQQ